MTPTDLVDNVARECRFLDVSYDERSRALWVYLTPDAPPRFSRPLLKEMRQVQSAIRDIVAGCSPGNSPIAYQFFGSHVPGTFSYGGDLELFEELIRTGDRNGLRRYAHECLELVYHTAVNYHGPVTTVSVVQGRALGGGFEAALAANVVIAERGVGLGFPEVLFNLFPGMGAHALVSRRLPVHRAEQLITSGEIHSAEDLYELGLVDILAEPGRGTEAAHEYVRATGRKLRGLQSAQLATHASSPISHDELLQLADLWVDTALSISDTDLRLMRHLFRRQAPDQRQAVGAA